ncbi:MAG: type II asparaginase [Burkholderiales bacterium]|nr:type II asparaginase [Burkholderiales bacterium]
MKKITLAILMSFAFGISFAKPTVEIIATGGTIAGVASSSSSTIYKAGSLSAQQLIDSVSGLEDLANITYQQAYNKDSGDLQLSDWIKLARIVQKTANKSNVNGIVITHGTDTMEETAYFLSLVINTKKPIVLVGSMRPATSISSDGPLNLYNAVAIAGSKKSINRGVMVAMNGDILDSHDVTKTNTVSVQTFKSPNAGPIGNATMGDVTYNSPLSASEKVPFSVNADTKLPDVAIIYEYAGVNPEMLDKIIETPNLKGIVIAGVGDGNIPSYEGSFLKKVRNKGIVIVRSSRVGSGTVTYDYNNLDTSFDLVNGNDLNPQKARILLMLALTKTNDTKKIQQYFNTY